MLKNFVILNPAMSESRKISNNNVKIFAVSILKVKEMKKRWNIISESFELENIESFGIDEEWQFNLARNLILSTNFN